REEAKSRGLDPNRSRLQEVGTNLRNTYGSQHLAERMAQELDHSPALLNVIVDGIKHPAEVNELRKKRFFRLLAIDAPEEVRFERIMARRRIGDPQDYDSFLEVDRRDRGIGGPETGQQVDSVIDMADQKIINVGTLEEMYSEVDRVINKLFGELVG